ncbi:response regulator [Desulfobacterales bacterium HSG16]|nr:response regulator [Desulfobacterales bacterium HSG16]
MTESSLPTGRRILIAEDNDVNLELICDMLSIHGHELIIARNGQEAVDMARSHMPELILMDMRMPVIDGMEATRQLKNMPEFADIPIIALTASADQSSIERQIGADCVEHLGKPIQTKELFAAIARNLKG